MSDEKVEGRSDQHAGESASPAPKVGPSDSGGNTDDRAPNAEGGQPAIGEDLPRNTEF